VKRAAAGQMALMETGGAAVARVRRYVDRQIRAQRAMGQLEPVDDGLIGVVMTMADIIDTEVTTPDRSAFTILTGLSKLAPILLELRGERRDTATDAGWDEELATLVAAIRDAARPAPADDG
jgi:hypothetical protein